MKLKVIFFLMFSLTCLVSLGERTKTDIEQIFNSYQSNDPHIIKDDKGLWNKMPEGVEISLSKAQKSGLELDSIEVALLSIFDDVILNSAVPNGYFIVDSGLIGVAKIDGTIVVPPVPGVPRLIDYIDGLRVGDTVGYKQIEDYFMKRVGKHRYGYAGMMSAVLDESTLNPIIPFGLYDYIFYTSPIDSSYYVAKEQIDENGNVKLKWGYLDKNGNEVIPCRFNAIIGDENGKMIGTDSVDMLNHLSELNVARANFTTAEYDDLVPQGSKLSRSQKFWIKVADKLEPLSEIDLNGVADFFVALGEGIISLDASLRSSGFYDSLLLLNSAANGMTYGGYSSYSGRGSSSGGVKTNSLSENQAYNSDKRTYSNYDSMLSAYYAGNRSATPSEVSQWKQKMRQLRNKWEKKGKSFPHSINEDR